MVRNAYIRWAGFLMLIGVQIQEKTPQQWNYYGVLNFKSFGRECGERSRCETSEDADVLLHCRMNDPDLR